VRTRSAISSRLSGAAGQFEELCSPNEQMGEVADLTPLRRWNPSGFLEPVLVGFVANIARPGASWIIFFIPDSRRSVPLPE
jgi:hypothetical protein